MSIIDDMRNDEVWDRFLAKKRSRAWDYTDILLMQSFIANRRYRPIVEAIAEGTYVFSDPFMMEVPKDNGKVRRVFSFKRPGDVSEAVVLQVMGQLLTRYEEGFCPTQYSLPKNGNVQGAMKGLVSVKDLNQKYLFKFDVTDYGNSIIVDKLLVKLEPLMDECDRPIYDVIKAILTNPRVLARRNGKLTTVEVEQKGVMTGLPFVSFLSGLYLDDMDWHFMDLGKPYFRYNDDICVVCESIEDAEEQKDYILTHITNMGLTTNAEKMQIIRPGDVSSYLGILINGDKLSITDKTVMKYKRKMKTKAEQFRFKVRNGEMTDEEAMDRTIKYINRTFYGNDDLTGNSFMSTYFNRITCSKGLEKIDHYAQHYIRYAYTGKYSKTNNRVVPYSLLKEHGYVPLVSAYRIYREN